MELHVALAKIKCKISGIFNNDKIQREYMIEGPQMNFTKIKEYSLLIDLVENAGYLTDCDLKELI